nr:MAG TPA: hypothetical protein [Caudoviricetes sp.]
MFTGFLRLRSYSAESILKVHLSAPLLHFVHFRLSNG